VLTHRAVEIDGEVDIASGIIRLSFVSELPVLRTDSKGAKYWEVLSHDPGDANLGRINRDGMLLANHDEKQEIGEVVKGSVQVEADKKTRASIKITDPAWKERIARGERPGVSVGAMILSTLSEAPGPDGIPVKRFAWSPYEISLLDGKPADDTVGIFRSAVDLTTKVEDRKNLTPERTKRMPETTTTTVDPAIERGSYLAADRKRIGDITRMADLFEVDHGKRSGGKFAATIRQLAQTASEKGDTADSFRANFWDAYAKSVEADKVTEKALGIKRGEYSLGRAIRSCVERNKAMPEGFELEIHQEICKRDLGVTPGGFMVPFSEPEQDIPISRTKRDSQATVFNTGGALVPTELLPPIELLRNRLISTQAGIRMLAGLTGGNILIPRQTAPATAYSVSEIATLTSSNLLLDQIAMAPHRAGATTNYSKQLLLQGQGPVEALIYDDAMQVLALYIDLMTIAGSGSNDQPMGILQTPGIGSVLFGGTATYSNIINFENFLDINNADSDASCWVVTPAVKNAWKKIAVALTGSTVIGGVQNALWVGKGRDGEVAGYRAMSTNQMPNNLALFGDFSSCMMAMWGGFDVVLDPYTLAKQAEYVLTMNTWFDIALRHPQKFCASADAGNQ